jgi:hypothetical protein
MNLEIVSWHVRSLQVDVANLPVAVYSRTLSARACCWRPLSHPAGLLKMLQGFRQGGRVHWLRVPVVASRVERGLVALVSSCGRCLRLWWRDQRGRRNPVISVCSDSSTASYLFPRHADDGAELQLAASRACRSGVV